MQHLMKMKIIQVLTVRPKDMLDSSRPREQQDRPQIALYHDSIREALLLEVSWEFLWFAQHSVARSEFKLASLIWLLIDRISLVTSILKLSIDDTFLFRRKTDSE